MTKRYYSVDGEILGDSEAGDYMRDALGSVTATCNPDTGSVWNTYRYKPYGSDLSSSGGEKPDPKFRWVGTAGYRQTSISHCASYVRARHYGHEAGGWTTIDLLWPIVLNYVYCTSNPITKSDWSGLAPNQGSAPSLPRLPIRCPQDGPAIFAYCRWCYVRGGLISNCKSICDYYASRYYAACNKSKRKPTPGEHWVPGTGGVAPSYPWKRKPKPRMKGLPVFVPDNDDNCPPVRAHPLLNLLPEPIKGFRHGLYCGPLISGPGTPVDCFDEACMRHDECLRSEIDYIANQDYCNLELINDLLECNCPEGDLDCAFVKAQLLGFAGAGFLIFPQ